MSSLTSKAINVVANSNFMQFRSAKAYAELAINQLSPKKDAELIKIAVELKEIEFMLQE